MPNAEVVGSQKVRSAKKRIMPVHAVYHAPSNAVMTSREHHAHRQRAATARSPAATPLAVARTAR
jgi:hypothetical protein